MGRRARSRSRMARKTWKAFSRSESIPVSVLFWRTSVLVVGAESDRRWWRAYHPSPSRRSSSTPSVSSRHTRISSHTARKPGRRVPDTRHCPSGPTVAVRLHGCGHASLRRHESRRGGTVNSIRLRRGEHRRRRWPWRHLRTAGSKLRARNPTSYRGVRLRILEELERSLQHPGLWTGGDRSVLTGAGDPSPADDLVPP